MNPEQIIQKIIDAKLIGRGGAGYLTGKKWLEMFQKKPKKMYMAVNGSEGEPGTLKDGYILENYLETLTHGIRIAYNIFPQTINIYIYLRKDYFGKYKLPLEKLLKDIPIIIFREPGGYLCGENTVLINSIEGKRYEPRTKPPYVSEKGLYGAPTIVNNLETFFRISQIVDNKYKDTRFYSLSGEARKPGVFDLSNNLTLSEVLNITGNYLHHNEFIQLGGGASGLYFSQEEINSTKANYGTGTIIIYNSEKISFTDLLTQKLEFLINENCGKCLPCREGIYRLKEAVDTGKLTEEYFTDIALTMAKSSLCGLGEGAGQSFLSLIERKNKIWPK